MSSEGEKWIGQMIFAESSEEKNARLLKWIENLERALVNHLIKIGRILRLIKEAKERLTK